MGNPISASAQTGHAGSTLSEAGIHGQHNLCVGTSRPRRAGFTLVELLVVISIMLLLTVITLTTVNLAVDADRVRSSGRQIQSYLAGARDRAIFSKEPRGVRFLLDPTDNRTVTSMVYIKPTDPYTQGKIRLERIDANADNVPDGYSAGPPVVDSTHVKVVADDFDITNPLTPETDWWNLYKRGLLSSGARIKLPNNSNGIWYRIGTNLMDIVPAAQQISISAGGAVPKLTLTVDYTGSCAINDPSQIIAIKSNAGSCFDGSYQLQLPPQQLPGAQPVQFAQGVGIDLDRSNRVPLVGTTAPALVMTNSTLPSAWVAASATVPEGFIYSSQMDVLFTPRGTITGAASQAGIIHLYLADQKDSLKDYWANNPKATGDKVVVTIFTQTGAVSVHALNLSDLTDPFKYAETGEVAGR